MRGLSVVSKPKTVGGTEVLPRLSCKEAPPLVELLSFVLLPYVSFIAQRSFSFFFVAFRFVSFL